MNALSQWISNHRAFVKHLAILAVFTAVGEYWNPYERLGLWVDEGVAIVMAPVQTVRSVNYRTTNVAHTQAQREHTVRSGESLWEIAEMYGTNVSTLQVANPKFADGKIKPADVLTIPNS